jgi:hypothetical protein
LHPSAASININTQIWDFYFDKLLALFAAPGDDGNYAATAASDLVCLQVKVPLLCNFSFVLYYAVVRVTTLRLLMINWMRKDHILIRNNMTFTCRPFPEEFIMESS